MQCNADNCDGNNLIGNKDLTQNVVEVKELESNSLSLFKKLIEYKEKEMISINNDTNYQNNDYSQYENFKLKNEEIDLKLECNDDYADYEDIDADQLSYEKVDIIQEISNGDPYRDSAIKDEVLEMNDLNINNLEVKKNNCLEYEVDGTTKDTKKCDMCCSEDNVGSNKLTHHFTNNVENDHLKGTFSARKLIVKLNISDRYLLNMHSATSKILKCNNSNNKVTKKKSRKKFVIQPRLKDGLKNNSQIFKCLHCTYETRSKTKLISHINSHGNIKDFKCTYCSKVYTRERDLSDHLLKIHKCRDVKKELYNCDQCSYETYFKPYLNKHVKFHKNIKNFKCTHCSKSYSRQRELSDHLLRIHNYRDVKKKLYNCDQCSYETYFKSYLNKHAKVHKNIKNFKCSYCSKDYTLKINLNDHLLKIHKCRDVTSNQYKCDQCSYETCNKHLFIKHMQIHENIKNFKCTYCSKDYAHERDLNDHLLKIHEYRDVKKNLYTCDQCSYKTYFKPYLSNHVKVHNNIKNFKCSYCSKGYSHKADLKNHLLKIHKSKNVQM